MNFYFNYREVITSENLLEKTSWLRGFADWLQLWEESTVGTKLGLSRETFQSAKQTCESLASVSEYLIHIKSQSYVLLGKIQSDKLEGRFGKLRQLTGGNLFASVRQFLESERTLKIKNLAMLDLSLADIGDIFSESVKENCAAIQLISDKLVQGLDTGNSIEIYPSVPEALENILFYVSGYFSRTIGNREKCNACKKLLISDKSNVEVVCENDSQLSPEENTRRIAYISEVNRGGLVFPSELVFSATVLAWDMYQKIKSNENLSQLLFQPNISAQNVFSLTFLNYLDSCENTRLEFIQTECVEGHTFRPKLSLLSKKFFNVVSKNYISVKNSEIHSSKKRKTDEERQTKRAATSHKLAKLQSGSLL